MTPQSVYWFVVKCGFHGNISIHGHITLETYRIYNSGGVHIDAGTNILLSNNPSSMYGFQGRNHLRQQYATSMQQYAIIYSNMQQVSTGRAPIALYNANVVRCLLQQIFRVVATKAGWFSHHVHFLHPCGCNSSLTSHHRNFFWWTIEWIATVSSIPAIGETKPGFRATRLD